VVAGVVAALLAALGAPEWLVVLAVSVGGYVPPFLWAWWACRRWGTGRMADDLGFRARPADAGWGPLTLLACWAAQIVVAVLVLAIGLPQGSNTEDLLSDDVGWAVLAALAVAAVVAAPVVEEVLFRGLLLRSLRSRLPAPAAVAVQALLFGVVHLTPGIGLGNVSLVLALSAVGAVLGVSALWTRRLAAPIVAHALLNAVALTVTFLVA
jgi:membrane protease YdiL (CAAX protease family)